MNGDNPRVSKTPGLLQDRFDDVGDKTHHVAIQLVLQQCCKISCTFFCCPFNRTLSAHKGMNVKLTPENVAVTFQCHADILTVSAPHIMVFIVCVIDNL